MSRTIEFDIKTVINVTMQTFWNNGMHTTLSDLEASTGLNRSSLYNTFGNKEALFRLAMMSYLEFVDEWINTTYSHLPFKEFLRTLLDDAATENFEGRGCFFVNCVGAINTLSKKNKEVLDMAYICIRNIYEKRILLAQQDHEFDFKINASAYATLMMATIAGLRAFNHSGFPKEDLQNAAAAALMQIS